MYLHCPTSLFSGLPGMVLNRRVCFKRAQADHVMPSGLLHCSSSYCLQSLATSFPAFSCNVCSSHYYLQSNYILPLDQRWKSYRPRNSLHAPRISHMLRPVRGRTHDATNKTMNLSAEEHHWRSHINRSINLNSRPQRLAQSGRLTDCARVTVIPLQVT